MEHQVLSLLGLPNTTWHSAPCPSTTEIEIAAFYWCLDHTSPGKFYFCVCEWWFELESDALLFTLKWGSK